MPERVLIITDDPDDARALSGVLGNSGVGTFETEQVTKLSAGLERLTEGGIDAIVTDLSLPDSEGIVVFDQLFAAAPHTPIMTLGALEDEALAVEAVQRGAQGYFSKGNFSSQLVPQVIRNVIQRKAVEEALYREKSRAEIALNSIGEAVICTDVAGKIDYLNIAAETLTGWSREEARGLPVGKVFRLVSGDTGSPSLNPVSAALRDNMAMGLHSDTFLVQRDGGKIPIEDSTAPIHDWAGQLTGAVVIFHDVSAARAMTMKMAYLAQHDFLTDLPNRVLLNDRIPQAVTLARRHGSKLAILFLDLDNFKHINDSLGHAIGDEVLQSVARRLSAAVRNSDTVSRQGGDEFVILLAECRSDKDAAIAAEKILAVIGLPHATSAGELHVAASIGIGVYPADGLDAPSLMRSADTAMYHAKEKGRNNYQFFSQEMNARAVNRQLIEAHLRRAMEKHECFLHFQPIIDLTSGAITGAEALLRWNHAEWGMVPPGRFIPIAEDCGLIVPIGRWVLRNACEHATRWAVAGFGPLVVAVNVSAVEFRHRDFVDSVHAIIADTGVDPRCLQLEITETALMEDAEASAAILHKLKAIGIQLAVDDFGTGYSSLSYLKQFPVDILKIDGSFVQDAAAVSGNGIIVSAVIGMGNNLGKRVVAEGVETEGQLAFLREHQCDDVQGFLFSRPLPSVAFEELLAAGLERLGRGDVAASPPREQGDNPL